MGERVGREHLLSLLLARAPSWGIDTLASFSPEDVADLTELRESLALYALSAPLASPSPDLRRRLLAGRPRPRGPRRPVLLVLDMINEHLTPGLPLEVPRARAIVPALQASLDSARTRGIPVIYACHSHPPDQPDDRDWPTHAVEGTPAAEVWPALAPAPGDVVLKKPTYSAFARTDLAERLATLGADQLILTGCSTEQSILATATDALQRGYVVTVPPDTHAGSHELLEQAALATLAMTPPFDPIYLRG